MSDDRRAIEQLLRLERWWRDQGERDKLAEAYVEDSHVRTTWFTGGLLQRRRTLARRRRHVGVKPATVTERKGATDG